MTTSVPLFKVRRPNCAIVGYSGITYKFQGSPHGRCWTTKPKEIEELLKLVEAGEGGIYIDAAEPEIDPAAATPYDVMKKKIIAEYLANQRAVKDGGEYEQSIQSQARAVGGTDENILTGSALAAAKNQAALTGQESPALAAAKAALASAKK